MDDVAAGSALSDAVDAGLRIIAGADQSESALRRRLQHRDFEPTTIDEAIAKLREYGYLNESRLAESIAARKLRNGYGRRRVAADLRGRGMNDEAIDQALTNVAPDDELESCSRTAAKWLEKHTKDDHGQWRRSLGGFLQRRGFGFDVIQAAMNRSEG